MAPRIPKIKWPKLPKMPIIFKTKKQLEQEIADLSEQTRQMINIKQTLLRRLANVPNINHDETVTNLEAYVARLQNIITGGRSPLLEITMIISNDHEDERAARIADYQGYAAQIVGERRVAEDLGQQLRREKALTQSARENPSLQGGWQKTQHLISQVVEQDMQVQGFKRSG